MGFPMFQFVPTMTSYFAPSSRTGAPTYFLQAVHRKTQQFFQFLLQTLPCHQDLTARSAAGGLKSPWFVPRLGAGWMRTGICLLGNTSSPELKRFSYYLYENIPTVIFLSITAGLIEFKRQSLSQPLMGSWFKEHQVFHISTGTRPSSPRSSGEANRAGTHLP